MSDKKINYTSRDYQAIKNELINFSKKYYPEISNDFNDASVGSWLLDLVSVVGDNLNYHIDRSYAENNINTSTLKSSVYNNARKNGVKIPGPKASMCEVELSVVLPIDSVNISLPDFKVAPIIKMGSVVGNSNYRYEIIEDVNFAEQFNSDGISNRTFSPSRDNNGIITAYTVTKTTVVIGGTSKIYKKILSETEVQPFMEIILPEKNIMSVDSVIFKESSNFNGEPYSYEYYIDSEKFKVGKENIDTYRFFETKSLSDQFRFGTKVNKDEDDNRVLPYNIEDYEEYNNGNIQTRYYRGEWKPVTQKFITEYTDNGYLKLIFGCGTRPLSFKDDDEKESSSKYAKHMLTKVMNNDLLGELPKIGWTMFVLYKTGGGSETNLAQGSINSIINSNISFVNVNDEVVKANVVNSLKVNNLSPSVGGKDMPSVEEIKYLTKYSTQSQDRCVTLKDYKERIMQIPPKYGCPFRLNALEDNNKIIMSCLGLNNKGKLDNGLPSLMVENMINYLSHYKTLGDYVEFRSGKIYNLGFSLDVFIDKNYDTTVVIKNIINHIKNYMKVENHDMGEDIFLGDLEKEINNLDGVISLIDLRVFVIYNGDYSTDIPSLPKKYNNENGCETKTISVESFGENSLSFEVDLDLIDHVLYSDYDSMFEILSEEDIHIKCKLR